MTFDEWIDSQPSFDLGTTEWMREAWNAATRIEREACADVCKQEAKLYAAQAIGNNTGAYDFMQICAEECEREIRARGDEVTETIL